MKSLFLLISYYIPQESTKVQDCSNMKRNQQGMAMFEMSKSLAKKGGKKEKNIILSRALILFDKY